MKWRHRTFDLKGLVLNNSIGHMKFSILLLLILCSCSQSLNLPPGYEIMHMQDGWYLRVNGQSKMQTRYQSKEEAVGQAYLMFSRDKSMASDPSHVKVDATLSVQFTTNSPATNGHIHRLVWVDFNIYGMPFRGLLSDNPISE